MFQFMFMVQLLVKFRFFIQELQERKSLQMLYECWRRAYHALLAQLFIVHEIILSTIRTGVVFIPGMFVHEFIIHDKNWCCFYFMIFVHELISSSRSESSTYPLYCSFNGELRHYWQWFWYTIQRLRYVFLSYSIVFKYFKMHQPGNISNIPFIVYHWTCLNVWYIVYTWRNSNNVRQMSGFFKNIIVILYIMESVYCLGIPCTLQVVSSTARHRRELNAQLSLFLVCKFFFLFLILFLCYKTQCIVKKQYMLLFIAGNSCVIEWRNVQLNDQPDSK